MTRHYPDLGSASDGLEFSIRSTTKIWVETQGRHVTRESEVTINKVFASSLLRSRLLVGSLGSCFLKKYQIKEYEHNISVSRQTSTLMKITQMFSELLLLKLSTAVEKEQFLIIATPQ